MRTPHLLCTAMMCAVVGVGCNRRDASIDTQQVREEARDAAVVAKDRIGDGWLATKIQAQYFADDDIRARDISVTADEGVVTLKGRVPDENAHAQAVQTARNTDGVTRVVDQLAIGPDQPAAPVEARPSASGAVATAGAILDDARVTSTVQSKFFLDDLVKGRRINVDTRQGVVTLRGEVATEEERNRALQLARSTEGVQRVEDALAIAAATAEPAIAPAITPSLDDAAVTTTIQAKYFLDREVKTGSIDVRTANGVVTVEGAVPSEAVRQRAIQIARETEGVSQVVDRLTINRRK